MADRYDLNIEPVIPGDVIAYCSRGNLYAAKVIAISYAGTLKVRQWLGEKHGYTAHVTHVRTYRIIKITPGMGVQTNK